MKKYLKWLVLLILLAGCRTQHDINMGPVEVKPIHITIDVTVRVDKELDNFFDDLDEPQTDKEE